MSRKQTPNVGWDAPPPSRNTSYLPIFSPPPDKESVLRVLNESLTAVVLHWVSDGYGHGRTAPCSLEPENCAGCLAECPKRWKGYLACLLMPRKVIVLAEITEHALSTCPALGHMATNLRGSELTLSRRTKRRNGPVVALLKSGTFSTSALPNPDPRPTLLNVWAGGFGAAGLRPFLPEEETGGKGETAVG